MPQEILLVVPGAEGEATGHQAFIEPDTTVADLLQAANLSSDQFQLQAKHGEKLVSLSAHDRVADHVQAGDKVFAVPSNMIVGTSI